jgi:hypothetical protein
MNRRKHGLMGYVRALIGLVILGSSEPASAAAVINNLAVTGSACANSPGPYVVQQAGFATGATQYIDRTFKIAGSVPNAINGQTFIQTCGNDKNLSPGTTNVVSFSVGQDSLVYILHDPTIPTTPTWLASNFTDLGEQITNDNSHSFEVFVSNTTYTNGSTVTLGSNVQTDSGTSYSMYSIVVVPSAALISGLTVNNSTSAGGSGATYAIQEKGFTAGAVQYVDRSYTIIAPVPTPVAGQTFIQTANGDKAVSPGSANFMSFTLGQAASVYVAIDQRVTTKPTWLTSSFTDTGATIQGGGASPGVPFELFMKSYSAGSVVTLGSNIPAGGNNQNSMYSVIAVPTGTGLRTVCASAVVVGLQWSAVSGATHYTLASNGNPLASPFPSGGITYTNWQDQTVAASTSYTYKLTALNSSNGTVSTQSLSVTTPAAGANGDPSYCPSSFITSMSVNWSSGVNQQDGSDLWSQTLGNDGNEYGFFGDGGGFGGNPDGVPNDPTKVSWGIGEIISSTPGTISNAVNVYGGASAQHPANISGKATGLLAVGSDFYAIGGVWGSGSGTGSAPNHQEIVSSKGNAWSWISNGSNWMFCTNSSSGGTFCPGTFLENGPGYSGNTDGYVYIYGGTVSEFYGNGTPGIFTAYLWRVTPANILGNTQYQAFTGLDESGNPTWQTGSFATLSTAMTPVFTARGSAALPLSTVVYNAGLKRYIASSEGNVNGVAFYEAPSPWGPWSAIGSGFFVPDSNNDGGWGNLGAGITSGWGTSAGSGLGINFAPKWTSSDGKTMWIEFSSNGNASTSASLPALQGKQLDSFSAVPVTFTTSN